MAAISLSLHLPAIQRCSDQAIVGIAGGVTSFCERSFILRLLQVEFSGAAAFSARLRLHVFSSRRRLYRHRLDYAEKLRGNRFVSSRAAETKTSIESLAFEPRAVAESDGGRFLQAG
ncbi:hypothetical protein [Sinorhizobium medicae]|uniref:hypothetical protein n=1 Tax=Sinorhizobium medicae TaxID=110321 RepID=UPI00048841D9|nr:hypothetical protein [Sinorhizobium medicae]